MEGALLKLGCMEGALLAFLADLDCFLILTVVVASVLPSEVERGEPNQ